jgi:hypothetical protein
VEEQEAEAEGLEVELEKIQRSAPGVDALEMRRKQVEELKTRCVCVWCCC